MSNISPHLGFVFLVYAPDIASKHTPLILVEIEGHLCGLWRIRTKCSPPYPRVCGSHRTISAAAVIRVVNGTALPANGVTVVKIQLVDEKIAQSALISSDLPWDIILVFEFFQKHSFHLDLGCGVLLYDDVQVSFEGTEEKQNAHKAVVHSTSIVPQTDDLPARRGFSTNFEKGRNP